MLKIIIPIAGTSDLFIKAGFLYPKPLIEINGTPMIELVIDKTKSITTKHQLIFVLKEEDVNKYHLDNTLKLLSPESQMVILKNGTKGALCSILMTIDYVEDNDSILILNGDQIINTDFNEIIDWFNLKKADVGIVTFNSIHPRWSFAKIENNFVVQTAEKNPISNNAIAGFYYFSNAKIFFENSFQCILNDVQLEGNFYISPVINEFILKNKKVFNYNVEKSNYHSFYSPQMINDYLNQH
jgi:NDP-sugar pyrophosphorylase family protein